MSKKPSESIIAIDEECVFKMKKMIESSISNLDRYGWRGGDSHATSDSKMGFDIFVVQLLLVMFLVLNSVTLKCLLGIPMFVIMGVVLHSARNGRGYHWKWLVINLVFGAVCFITYGIGLISCFHLP